MRRSLDLFIAPAPPSTLAIAKLEKALFSGLPLLLQRIDRMARIAPLNINTLDPRIVRRFVAPDSRWRIEVSPIPGVGNIRFADGVRAIAPDAVGETIVADESAGMLRRDAGRWLLAFAGLALIFAVAAIRNLRGIAIFLAAAAVLPGAAMGLVALTGSGVAIGQIIAMIAAGAGALFSLCIAPIRWRENRALPDEDDTSARAGLSLQAASLALALPAIVTADENLAAFGIGVAAVSATCVAAGSCLQPLAGSLLTRRGKY